MRTVRFSGLERGVPQSLPEEDSLEADPSRQTSLEADPPRVRRTTDGHV